MGKGDKKTKRGKIILGTYGKKRRKNRTQLYVAPVKKNQVKKTAPVFEEVVVEIEEVVAPKAEVKKAAPKKTTAKETAAPKKEAAPKKTATKKAEDTEEKAPAKPKATK